MNTILQSTRRGKLDEETAAAMKKLAKDKMLRALSDQRYASTVYEREMTQQALFGSSTKEIAAKHQKGGEGRMDTVWTWELPGYCAKYSFLTEPKGLTIREVERVFQLDPEPPVLENMNDYIIEAVHSRELCWFSFFLHHYENRLNNRVRRFLLREGLDRYDPERFLDYKMGCVLAMLNCLREYDPAQGADFLTYAHHFIGNALLTCRMQRGDWFL